MNKEEAIRMSWRISTLSKPKEEIIELLMPLDYKFVLELLLILRKNPNKYKDPTPFLKNLIEDPLEFEAEKNKTNKEVFDKAADFSKLNPLELGNIRNKKSVEYLIPFLESNNSNEKSQATTAIKKLARAFPVESKKALILLDKNLNDISPKIRHYTLSALERFTINEEIKEKIICLSKNDNKDYVRKAAIRIIRKKDIKSKKRYVGNRGIVYFISENLSGSIKIGKTQNLNNRLTTFGLKLPFDVELVYKFECGDCHQVEKFLHDYFKDKRKNGEWFDITKADIEWIINEDFPKEMKKFI